MLFQYFDTEIAKMSLWFSTIALWYLKLLWLTIHSTKWRSCRGWTSKACHGEPFSTLVNPWAFHSNRFDFPKIQCAFPPKMALSWGISQIQLKLTSTCLVCFFLPENRHFLWMNIATKTPRPTRALWDAQHWFHGWDPEMLLPCDMADFTMKRIKYSIVDVFPI